LIQYRGEVSLGPPTGVPQPSHVTYVAPQCRFINKTKNQAVFFSLSFSLSVARALSFSEVSLSLSLSLSLSHTHTLSLSRARSPPHQRWVPISCVATYGRNATIILCLPLPTPPFALNNPSSSSSPGPLIPHSTYSSVPGDKNHGFWPSQRVSKHTVTVT